MTQANTTRETFMFIGTPSFKDEGLVKDTAFTSGWTKRRLSFAIAVSSSNRPFVEMEYGFYPEGHAKHKARTVIKTHKKGKDNKWESYEVPFAERFDKKHIDAVVDARKIKVALVPEIDAEGKITGTTDNKEFLLEEDAIAYVKANLKKDMRVAVYGETKYSRYLNKNGDVVVKKERVIKQIRVAKHDEKNDSAGTTTFYFTADSFDDGDFREFKKYRINAFQCAYVEKGADGKAINDIIPVEYVIDCSALDMDNPEHQAPVNFLKGIFEDARREEVYKTTWRYKVFEGNEEKEVTMDDLSDHLKQMIQHGFLTEEEAMREASGGGYGDRISELKLVRPKGTEPKEHMEDLTEEDLESLPLGDKVKAASNTPAPTQAETQAAESSFDDFFAPQ